MSDTAKPIPSQSRLCELFDYNPNTGNLTWRERPSTDFPSVRICNTWNTKYSGKPAGSVVRSGYCKTDVDGVQYCVHRLIWVIIHGDIGKYQVDHINQHRADNRIENLRLIINSENQKNKSKYRKNTSGYNGVVWDSRYQKWRAQISANGKRLSLGYFPKIEDAVEARLAADIVHGYHPNHGKAASK